MGKRVNMDKKEMIKLRLDGFTYSEIGRRAGVSRQRIQQIISPPKAIRDFVIRKYNGHCMRCGLYVGKGGHIHHEPPNEEEDYNDIEKLQLLCISCHRKIHSKPPQLHCIYCGKLIKKGLFCSKECWSKTHTTTCICFYCGKEFTLLTSQAKAHLKRNQNGQIFCSKSCWMKWRWKEHKFWRSQQISSDSASLKSHQTTLGQKLRGARGKVIQFILSKVG